jgi:maltose alpha-D-glucosyltransferase/alpha-amylase
MILTDDPCWYKDAVIYELHVRSFFDGNDDGIGDFPGLIRKLDYIRDLGVNTIWLLPFYPSPLKDDGYDIADYRNVHPSYGTLRDFKQLLREAHDRGLRVFTELVVNHTSDQHPWFQAARRAPKGSAKRDYYVWSDTGREYENTRIIFTDTEKSNWTWDPEAKAYYWHRFFSHQPDLNYDNPHVLRAVMRVMHFWLAMGVDGMRLDAVPYLIEREGTNCENLPETHTILKRLRAEVDAHFPGVALLAEANQWPADVRPYFGDGDECHMAYHFPLMPRIFMAVRQEDALPIIEILRQTPDIPSTSQWALFLRNHDELTLEMVTDEERDYMYRAYAADPQMRLNVGIRRRLAPLMEHDRARVELLNGLLLSMPGSPIIYYGDELGMGDNVYLGDRNGVRTPMQWTGDRNAGFSRADPQRLFAPPVMDPLFGYQAINVEAQERAPSSLLHFMRRMLALRRQYTVFGRGSIDFVPTDNRRVLAYVREDADHQVLVVANLARSVQPVHLDLSRFRGLHPIELVGEADMPVITDQPYFLTVGPHNFYWFRLARHASPIVVQRPRVGVDTEGGVPKLLASAVWENLLDGHLARFVEREGLAAFLMRQRWAGTRDRVVRSARFLDRARISGTASAAFLTIVEAELDDGSRPQFFLPLATATGDEARLLASTHPEAVLASISGARAGILFDGMRSPSVCGRLFQFFRDSRTAALGAGRLEFTRVPAADALFEGLGDYVRVATAGKEQTNSNVMLADRFVLKAFRRLPDGINPDVEVGQALAGRDVRVPALAGWADYVDPQGRRISVAMLQQQVPSRGTAWERALSEVQQYYERVLVAQRVPGEQPVPDAADAAAMEASVGAYWTAVERLARRTAELHATMAAVDRDGFGAVPLAGDHLRATVADMTRHANRVFDQLAFPVAPLPPQAGEVVTRLLAVRQEILERIIAAAGLPDAGRAIRTHGDYHLGQVLEVDADVAIIDFEGEPARPIAERRMLQSPLRDVAGMLRSFGYAAQAGLRVFLRTHPEAAPHAGRWAHAWEAWIGEIFLKGYLDRLDGTGLLPADPAAVRRLLEAYVADKTVYELGYELGHRPDWVDIPATALLGLDPSPGPIGPAGA